MIIARADVKPIASRGLVSARKAVMPSQRVECRLMTLSGHEEEAQAKLFSRGGAVEGVKVVAIIAWVTRDRLSQGPFSRQLASSVSKRVVEGLSAPGWMK